jgi:hypothetical protein
MSDTNFNDHINKKDLEIILEVNKKAIEIETGVADQNEEILLFLQESKKAKEELQKSVDKINTKADEISKDLFRIQVLFITGLLSLVIQIIEMFVKK